MALTRPRLEQFSSNVASFSDPLTVLHAGATSANTDVGFIFNRANGLVSNVALVWRESTQSFIIALTDSTGVTNTNVSVTSYANVTTGNITANGFFFANGAAFTSSSYGNTDVAAYLPTNSTVYTLQANLGAYQTYANSTIQTLSANIGTLVAGAPGALDTLYEIDAALSNNASFSSVIVTWLGNITTNVTTANTNIQSISSNLGEYQTYANTGIQTISANLGAYESYANAQIGTINANLGSYQTYANTSSQTINANLGAYQSYGNTSLQTLNANVGAYETFANTRIQTIDANLGTATTNITNLQSNAGTQQTQINSLATNANANVAAYLPTYSGSLNSLTTLTTSGNATIGGTLNVIGNLNVTGNLTTFSSNDLVINDSIIYIADGNTGDVLDIGIVGHFVGASYQHTGFVRDASDGVWKLFANVTAEPGTTIDFTNATYSGLQAGTLYLNNTGDVSSNVGSLLANASIQATSINSINANIGAYQAYGNTSIQTINANIGAFESYANTSIQTIDANLGAYQTYANSNAASQQTSINSLATNANANTAAYLAAGVSTNIQTTGNVTATTFTFANGVNILTTVSAGGGSGIGNVNQTLYAGNVTSTSTTASKLVDSVSTTGNTLVRWTTTSTDVTNSRFRVSTFDVLSDGTNVYYTEYGTIKSNSSYNVSNFTSNIYAGTIALWATTPDSTNTTIVYQRVILGSSTPQGYLNTGQTGATGQTGPAGSISNTSGNIVTTSSNVATGASNSTGALQVGGGAGIAGALYVGGIASISGNTTVANITATGFYFANGAPFVSSSYGNTDVATYLPNYTGNLTAGNVTTTQALYTTTGIYWAGNRAALKSGSTYTASVSAPSSPQIGDQWYSTSDNILYQYINDGTTSYWVDTTSSAVTSTTFGNTEVAAYLVGSNNGFGTISATNFSTANARISGGYISAMSNVTTSGAVTAGNVITTSGVYWANGASYSSGSGGGGVTWQTATTANITAVVNLGYLANTTAGNITVTMPSSATAGSYLSFVDYARTFSNYPLTLYPNGLKIQGNTANVVVSTNGQAVNLVYTDSTQGWVNYSTGSSIGPYLVDYLIVAGGGAGGASSVNSSCGGGGAGGYISGTALSVTPGASYSITVGAGGSAATNDRGGNGSNSTAFSLTSIGGGGGGGGTSGSASSPGASGGSGGGSLQPSSGGSGTAGQGNAGGTGNPNSPIWGGGGGGGASAAGANGTSTAGGAGGNGSQWSNGTTYAGGGGGAAYNGYLGGGGGTGGGGPGGGYSGSSSAGTAGTANTGGGGGGGSYPGSSYVAGAGGSGIVIVRYPSTYQKASGGTITITGGYVYHTFNSSGTFTA